MKRYRDNLNKLHFKRNYEKTSTQHKPHNNIKQKHDEQLQTQLNDNIKTLKENKYKQTTQHTKHHDKYKNIKQIHITQPTNTMNRL